MKIEYEGILSSNLISQIIKIEKDKNLIINFIRDINDLADAGKNGLFSMYKNIFSEPPYFEKFSIKEVKTYFKDILDKGGFIFTASTPKKEGSNLLTAFVASVPLIEKPAIVDVISPYVDIKTSSYFAEDAVISERRREGISREMKKLLLNKNKESGYETLVLRTSKNSFNQVAAVKQLGGQQIENLYQEVNSLRLDKTVKPDTRIFFTFDLKKNIF